MTCIEHGCIHLFTIHTNPLNGVIWPSMKSNNRPPNDSFYFPNKNVVATLPRQLIVARRGTRCCFYCFLFAWMMLWDWIYIVNLFIITEQHSGQCYRIYCNLFIHIHYKCFPLNQLFCNEKKKNQRHFFSFESTWDASRAFYWPFA